MSGSSKISTSDVVHVSKLAHLSLSTKQVQAFESQLDAVLDYVSSIQELATDTVAETHQVTGTSNVFREDVIDEARILSQAEALGNATRTSEGYFVVPAVITT